MLKFIKNLFRKDKYKSFDIAMRARIKKLEKEHAPIKLTRRAYQLDMARRIDPLGRSFTKFLENKYGE